MLVALLALFVALGGSSYALTIPRNSVGTTQIKKNAVTRSKLKDGAVTSSKVKDRSLLADDFKAGQLPRGQRGPQGDLGPQGERGPAGQGATKLFAYIRDLDGANTANVQYGTGVTALNDLPGDDSYILTFNRGLVNCVVQAVAGFGDPPGSPTGGSHVIPLVDLSPGNANQVEVTFRTDAGALRDTSFMVTAFC